jgi:hypothetical protein
VHLFGQHQRHEEVGVGIGEARSGRVRRR